jgi:hypothetical protein
MVEYPFSFPLLADPASGSKLAGLWRPMRELAKQSAPWLALLVLYALAWRRSKPPITAQDARPALAPGSVLPLLVAASLLLVPPSVLAMARFGGSWNSLSPCLYFGALASALAIARLPQRNWKATLTGGAALVLCAGHVGSLLQLRESFARLDGGAQEIAFRFARERPGEVYFPQYPLVGLLAEGELYHSYFGFYDRRAAALQVSEAHLRAHVPPEARFVAVHQMPYGWLRDLLPEYATPVSLPGLPGFTVYARAGDGASGSR